MDVKNKQFGVGAAAGIVGILLLLLVITLFIVYSGSYNVAATEDHTPVVRWAFTTTMKKAVAGDASGIKVPEPFGEEMVAAGAREYKAMCQHCHGGVGVDRDEWAQGMLPQPPHLRDAAAEWEPNEVFWLVKHGLKMTGMPAFGPTHSDEALWNIAAFVDQLPGMTAEEYSNFEGDHTNGGHHGRTH